MLTQKELKLLKKLQNNNRQRKNNITKKFKRERDFWSEYIHGMLSALKARVPRFEFEFRRSTTDSSSSEDEEDENTEEDEEKRGKKDDDFDDDDSMTPPRKQPAMSSSLRKNGTRGGDKDTKSRLGKKNRVVSFDDGTFSDEEVEEEGGDDEEMLLFGTIIGSSEKSIEIDLTKCAEKMRLVLERCTRMGMSLVECARAVGSNGRYSHRKRISSKNRNGGASSTYGRGGRGGDKASDMKSYYVESRKKMQKRTRRLVVPRVVISVVLFWTIMYLWYRKRTMMDGLGVEKRIGESESMKNARLEVDAAKKGDYNSREKFHSSRETTFSGGIFPSHERVGSAEYERETERLMEALAKRIATGQHHSADFNDARRHVREHRMRNNLVHVDNAEVMRLREAKRQLRDDFLQMGPKCEFDTSGMSRESIKDMKEECKEFFREEEKRIGKIPLLDDAKYKVHADNQLDREHFRGHRQKLPTIVDIRAMDMVPH